MDAKTLHTYLIEVYLQQYNPTNVSDYGEMYSTITNILMVYLGLRPAYLMYLPNKWLENQLLINKQLIKYGMDIYHQTSGHPRDNYRKLNFSTLLISNQKEITKRDLNDEYVKLVNQPYIMQDDVILGKILGYRCQVSDLVKDDVKYYEKKDNSLRMRYLIGFNVFPKEDGQINMEKKGALWGFVCYDLEKKDEIYKQCKKDLILYQRAISEVTVDLHVGLEYTEQTI